MAHPLDDENLLRVFSRFLATAEVVRLAAASRTWRNTFRGYFNNPVQVRLSMAIMLWCLSLE